MTHFFYFFALFCFLSKKLVARWSRTTPSSFGNMGVRRMQLPLPRPRPATQPPQPPQPPRPPRPPQHLPLNRQRLPARLPTKHHRRLPLRRPPMRRANRHYHNPAINYLSCDSVVLFLCHFLLYHGFLRSIHESIRKTNTNSSKKPIYATN